jgi:polyhydroxybutyrate depolymerase
MKNVAIFACVALLLAGAPNVHAESIDIGRGEVPLTVPEDYSKDSPAPLIVLLHGYTSSGKQQEGYMKFGKIVDEYGFLYLVPDGTKENSERAPQFWNATEACCNFAGSDVDDSAYILSLINEVKKQYSVDDKQVYLIGHSNGGFMCHRMAQDHPDTIAAVASLAGAAPSEIKGPTPSNPVNILQIHGTNDTVIQFEGGDTARMKFPGAEGSLEKWAEYNGIEANKKEVRKKLDLDKRIDGKETTITRWNKEGDVELWSIVDGSHIPAVSDTFTKHVVEWLLDHPKE